MYLQDFLRLHTSGQGGVVPSDACGESSHEKMTPHSSHVPLFSIEQSTTRSMTPPRSVVCAHASDPRTPDHVEEGVNLATFLGYFYLTSTGAIHTTFLVDEELTAIKIEKTLGNYYALLKLVFII